MLLRSRAIPNFIRLTWFSLLGLTCGSDLGSWKRFPDRVEHVGASPSGAWASYVHRPAKTQIPDIQTEYFHEAYFHPLKTPKGRVITDDYPLDHLWQRGLWIAWTQLSYEGQLYDFWNQGKETPVKAKVHSEQLSIDTSKGSLNTQHRFVIYPSPSESLTLLEEKWTITAQTSDAANVLTLESIQTNVSGKVLHFPQHSYGGLGLRTQLQDTKQSPLLVMTSEAQDRFSGNAQPAKWVWMGESQNGPGVLLLIHKSHPFFPVPIRINPQQPQLSVAPSILGDWELQPSESFTQKFRLMLMDRTPSHTEASQWWKDFHQES